MRTAVYLLLVVGAATAGAAHLTDPKKLQAPSEPTCIDLKEPLSFTRRVGLLKVPWTMRLERGPYISEKVDDRGTFYRAPPGGIRLAGNEPATPGHGRTYDGGFYVADSVSEPVKIYFYDSNAPAPVEVPPSDADCSTAGYLRDPATSNVTFIGVTVIGTGGKLSFWHAVGTNVGAGLIAGAIITATANVNVGKIYFPSSPSPDSEFLERLKELAAGKVRLKALPAAVAAPESR